MSICNINTQTQLFRLNRPTDDTCDALSSSSLDSLVETRRSFCPVLMLNCDTLLLDPETLAFGETASALKKTERKMSHRKNVFIVPTEIELSELTCASAPL